MGNAMIAYKWCIGLGTILAIVCGLVAGLAFPTTGNQTLDTTNQAMQSLFWGLFAAGICLVIIPVILMANTKSSSGPPRAARNAGTREYRDSITEPSGRLSYNEPRSGLGFPPIF